MPVITIASMFALSLLAPSLITTGQGALALGVGSNVVLYGVSALALPLGVLLVALVNVHAHYGATRPARRAVRRAVAAFPRLAAALALLLVALASSVILWPIVTMAFLILAATLIVRSVRSGAPTEGTGVKRFWSRVTPGARRALVWAVPCAPLVAVIAMGVAVFPAILIAPNSMRGLLWEAWHRVRTRRGALVAFALAALLIGAIASLGGVAAAAYLDPHDSTDVDGAFLASLAALVIAMVVLQVATGAALAVLTPGATTPDAPRRPRASFRSVGALMSRGTRPALGRTAMVVVLAVIATLAPLPASAQTVTDPTLVAPELTLTIDGVDASPLITASVIVAGADGSGSVQFLDGETPLGAPVALAVDSQDASRFTAVLAPLPVLAEGSHEIAFVYAPASAAVSAARSAATAYAVGMKPAPEATPAPEAVTPLAATPPAAQSKAPEPQAEPAPIKASSRDAPTEVSATVYNSVTIGYSLDIAAQVTATGSPDTVVPGTVLLFMNGKQFAEIPTSAPGDFFSLSTEGFTAGDATITVMYPGAPGFAPSETTVDIFAYKANTSLNSFIFTPEDFELTWGETQTLSVTVTSSVDEARTLELLSFENGAFTLLDTVPFTIVDGSAQVTADFTKRLSGGEAKYAVRVPETDQAEGWGGEYFTATIAAVETTTTISATGPDGTPSTGAIGMPVTLTATIASPASDSTPASGLVRFTSPGQYFAPVLVGPDGTASVTYTPTSRTPVVIDAEYVPNSGIDIYLRSTGTVTLEPGGYATDPASAQWHGALTVTDTRLTVSYPAATGVAPPTGTIVILDGAGSPVPISLGLGDPQTSFSLSGGAVTLLVPSDGGELRYRVAYSGDDNYTPRTDALPVVTVRKPSISLDTPQPTYLGEQNLFSVALTDVDPSLVRDVTIYATDAAGTSSVVGTVRLDHAGVGGIRASLPLSGPTTLTAHVRFTPASGLSSVSSAPRVVTVPAATGPAVSTSIDYSTIFSAGRRDVGVTVRLSRIGEPVDVPAGTVVTITDDRGVEVGLVTITTANTSGSGTVSLTRSSTRGLVATVPYGDGDATASSPAVTVEPPTRQTVTTISTTHTAATTGNLMRVDVAARVFGTPLDSTRSIPVTVEIDGIRRQVSLTRTAEQLDLGWLGSTAFYAGSATFTLTEAGRRPLTVTGAGNGTDIAPISYGYAVFVDRHTSELKIDGLAGAVGGKAFTVTPRVTVPDTGAPAPSGTVTLTVWPSGRSCEVAVGQPCALPAGAATGGMNTVTASYPGDAHHLPDALTEEFSAAGRTTQLTAGFSVAPSGWIVGETVTATWKTTTSGTAPVGWVYVDIDGVRCGGPAASGACDFAVPPASMTLDGPRLPYSVTFTSGDDAPSKSVTGQARPRYCSVVWVQGDAKLDLAGAEKCSTRGTPGVIEGSTVRLRPGAIPTNHVFDTWYFNNTPVTGAPGRGGATAFVITKSGSFFPTTKWAPKCFTLTVAPNTAIAAGTVTRSDVKGSITVLTMPNCASPTGPTADERTDLAAGKPRYAAGTVVDVRAEPQLYERPIRFYDVAAFTGVVPEPQFRNLARVTMTGNRAIGATFAVPDCQPVTLLSSPGGSVSVVSATRPASSGALKPANGACTTVSGALGFVPDTVLDVEAVPETGAVVSKVAATTSYPSPAELAPAVSTTAKETGTVERMSVTVAPRAETFVRAVFGYKDCVTVVLRQTWPAGSGGGRDHSLMGFTEKEQCAPPVNSPQKTESGFYSKDVTYSLLSSAYVRAEAAYDWLGYHGTFGGEKAQISWSLTHGSTTTVSADWAKSFTFDPVLGYVGRDGDTGGPAISLSKLPPSERTVVISGAYVRRDCSRPYVSNPFSVPYQQRTLSTVQKCKDPTTFAPGETVELRAAPSVIPTLAPAFSASAPDANGGRFYYNSTTITVDSRAMLALEYCAALPLTVRTRDDSGTYTTLNRTQSAALIADDGGCAPMNTRPGGTVSTGLTPQAAYQYSFLTTPAAMPKFTVDAQGRSAPATLDLAANCVTVNVGDRTSRKTPANCPGGASNRFLKGTVVQFHGDVHDDEGLDGWNGADEQQGVTAWVVAETDRHVEVDIDYPSIWEKIGNAFSNLAARIVAAAVVVATGIALGKAMLLKMVSAGLKGIGTLVSIAGGGDGMLNAMTKFDNGVTAVLGSATLLGTCLSTSARGSGNLTDLPSGTLTPNGVTAVNGGIAATNAGLTKFGEVVGTKQGGALVGSLATAAGAARGVVDVFGSNVNLYTRPAAQVWTTMGNDLGGCMESGMRANADLFISR
ncbi:MAG: hypothetical protein JWM50_1312 [Microbacteriaceae bacterium]|jgi:hypothetical protein|nr:hypothetical protein [Microbacteriaceae bacterium]